uniref:Uncharacterized protein n=1 Tax=Anguilla anguilla TaxID=7936 RepID=A0A0E9VVZ2_ANGAN
MPLLGQIQQQSKLDVLESDPSPREEDLQTNSVAKKQKKQQHILQSALLTGRTFANIIFPN